MFYEANIPRIKVACLSKCHPWKWTILGEWQKHVSRQQHEPRHVTRITRLNVVLDGNTLHNLCGKTFFVQFRETEESPKRRPGQGTLNTKSNVSVQFIFYPCLCVTFCFVSSSVCHPGAERRRHQERTASSWRDREERSTTSCI